MEKNTPNQRDYNRFSRSPGDTPCLEFPLYFRLKIFLNSEDTELL